MDQEFYKQQALRIRDLAEEADPFTKQRLLAFPHIVVELTGSGEEGVDGFVDDRGVMRYEDRPASGPRQDFAPAMTVNFTVPTSLSSTSN